MTFTKNELELIKKYLNKATTTEGHADVEDIPQIGTVFYKADQLLANLINSES